MRDLGEEWEVLTDPCSFEAVRTGLEAAGLTPTSAEVTLSHRTASRSTGASAKSVLKLIDGLEDHDDVQAVYANFDIPEDVLAEVG